MSSTNEKTNEKEKEKNGGKTFRDRVQEFQMWTDEDAFKELDYERRREDKKRKKGVLKSDKKLQRSRKCYAPAIVLITVGCVCILCSTIDHLAEETIFHQYQRTFQILGGVFVGLGLLLLMATAVYTYHREDTVRAKHGFPSLFESSKQGTASCAYLEETLVLKHEFVNSPDIDEYCNGRLSRMTSYESSTSIGNLGHSFSSTSTTKTWVNRHAHRFQRSTSTIRRQNSDTALDQSFARARFLSWREEAAQEVNPPGEKQPEPGPGESQTYSISSTTSSGYHSLVSSPTLTIHSPTSNTEGQVFISDLRNNKLVMEEMVEDNGDDTSHLQKLENPEETTLDSVKSQIFRIVVEDTHGDAREEEIIVLPDLLSKLQLRHSGEVISPVQSHTQPEINTSLLAI